ncbi:hypothetical protein BDY24DRAFT_433932 [Mrakia frigida]|uniref:ribonuclease Z family protein n=1 Tax=Mrakia frigida TaxID=29902 RepID=UPI003FCC1047
MEYFAKVLSPRTVDSEPSLVIRFPTSQYLFNVGEGTQRIFQETNTSTKYMEGVFLTGLSTEEAGGLSGMMFTLADKNSRAMTIVGPENLSHLVSSMRGYYNRSDLYLNLIERPITTPFPDDAPIFKDSLVTVYSVLVNPHASSLENDTEPPRKRKRSLSPSAAPMESEEDVDPARQLEFLQVYRREALLRMSAHLSPFLAAPTKDPRPLDPRLPNPFLLPPPSSRKLLPPDTHNTHLPRPLVSVPLDARLCYIVVGPVKRGKFMVEAADALGVPRQQRGLLAGKGESVWVDDETVEGGKREVTPSMCLGKEIPASVTLVIDCPSPAHIDQLVSNPIWDKYRVANEDGIYPVHVVWHRWGTWENDERYRTWLNSFGPDVHHLSGDQSILGNPTVFNSAAATSVNLSLLDPEIFRRQDASPGPSGVTLPPNHYPLNTTQTIDILPRQPPASLDAPPKGDPLVRIPVSSQSIVASAALSTTELERKLEGTVPAFVEALKEAREAIRLREGGEGREKKPGDDVVITTLGTGSSLPSKYRNVSSTHVLVPGHGGILLDCGEGTLGQLSRSFGSAGVSETLRNLKFIFISHMHADHHTGLIRLLSLRRKVTEPSNTLFIVGPDRIRTMISETQEFQEMGYHHDPSQSQLQFGACFCLLPTFTLSPAGEQIMSQLYASTGIRSLKTCLVPHRGTQCYAVIIEHQDGWKLVYSGDTKPSEALIEAGQDATILIHEATIGDDTPEEISSVHEMRKFASENDLPVPEAKLLVELAAAKGHSTFAQAISVGRRMHAQNLLLTHFSQRYPKAVSITIQPPLPSASPRAHQTAQTQNVGLSLDLIRIPIGSMWKMALFQPAVEALYATLPDEEDGEEEVKVKAVVAGAGAGAGATGKKGGKEKKEKVVKEKGGSKGGGGGGKNGKKGGEEAKVDVAVAVESTPVVVEAPPTPST